MAASSDAGPKAPVVVDWEGDALPCAVKSSPDGSLVATALSNLAASKWDGQIALHKATGGDLVASANTEHAVSSVAWVSGHQLVAGLDSGDVQVLDVTAPTGQADQKGWSITPSHTIPAHNDCVSAVASRQGAGSGADGSDSVFASGSWDGSIKVWAGAASSTAQGKFEGHFARIHSVAWQPSTPGTNLLASGSDDGRCLVWDMRSSAGPAAVAPYRSGTPAAGPGSLVFSPSTLRPHEVYGDSSLGSLVWSSATQLVLGADDGGLLVVDLRNLSKPLTAVVTGHHSGPVHALAALPPAADGAVRVVTGGDDGAAKLVQIAPDLVGEPASTLHAWEGLGEYVRTLAAPTGDAILAGLWDGTTRSLPLPTA